MNKTSNRRGSMLLMVIIMLICAAIIAMKLLPDEQTQVIRENETFYDSDLSQLREAIDMVKLASRDPNSKAYYLDPEGWQDFCASDTSASISAKIAKLSSWGFLRKSDLRDKSVPEHLWNVDNIYWKVSINYASNSSFEIASTTEDWSYPWERINASATLEKNIKLNSLSIDEYPFQNKLGDSTHGENSIRMIKITKEPISP